MPTLASGGGPAINTGNAAWDQGLGSLGGALFPDPSKVAQAGYYGAEQRNKQLQSSKLRDQMARQQALDEAAKNLTMPDTSYAASPEGPNMPPIMQPPGSAPAPTPTLSATVAPGPAAAAPPPPAAPAPAPAAPVAPAAGTVGANMTPAGLSALFAGGGGAVPDGGGTVRLDQGTPPPTSSPAPGAGAPPASNATASDGSVPTNDAVSGIFHPGSITPPGGGRKTTGPADANGAPAKPMITAAQYVNLAVSAGHDAQQALLDWRSMISSKYDTGQIDENTYHHMMGAADPSIITTDATNTANIKRTGMEQAGATTRTGMEQAGATTRTGMTEAGATTRTGMTEAGATQRTQMTTDQLREAHGNEVVETVDENGQKTLTKRKDLKPGQPGYDPTLANTRLSAAIAPVTVQPGGPNTPTYSETTETAQKNRSPLYQSVTETQQGATGNYVDPNNPTQLIPATFAQAQQRGLVSAPTSMEGWNALAASASANAKTPEEAQAIRDKVMAFAVASAPKATTPNESVQNANIADQRLALRLPPPVGTGAFGTGIGGGAASNTLPAGSSPELEVTLQNLTDQYFSRSPDPAIRGNRVAASDAAVQQLIEEGRIDPSQSRTTSVWPGANIPTTINKSVYNPASKTIEPKPHFRVDLLDPKTKKPVAPGAVVSVPMAAPPLSSVVAPTAAKGQPPAGALGPAPPGAADGTTGTTSTGQRGVVKGGWVFPAASAAAPGPGGGG
jgi:hypothetical protein